MIIESSDDADDEDFGTGRVKREPQAAVKKEAGTGRKPAKPAKKARTEDKALVEDKSGVIEISDSDEDNDGQGSSSSESEGEEFVGRCSDGLGGARIQLFRVLSFCFFLETNSNKCIVCLLLNSMYFVNFMDV